MYVVVIRQDYDDSLNNGEVITSSDDGNNVDPLLTMKRSHLDDDDRTTVVADKQKTSMRCKWWLEDYHTWNHDDDYTLVRTDGRLLKENTCKIVPASMLLQELQKADASRVIHANL
jgi:hypothetical protein